MTTDVSSWTIQALYAKAAREGVSLSELGRRGGKKAARLKAKQKRNQQSQLTLAL